MSRSDDGSVFLKSFANASYQMTQKPCCFFPVDSDIEPIEEFVRESRLSHIVSTVSTKDYTIYRALCIIDNKYPIEYFNRMCEIIRDRFDISYMVMTYPVASLLVEADVYDETGEVSEHLDDIDLYGIDEMLNRFYGDDVEFRNYVYKHAMTSTLDLDSEDGIERSNRFMEAFEAYCKSL